MGMHENQTYEVQVYNNGRWQAHARYPFHERAVAIREAKELTFEKRSSAIRVVLEDYNPRTGRHDERLIYKNGVEPKAQKTPRATRTNNWADVAVSSDGRVGYLDEDIDQYWDSEYLFERPKARVSTMMFLGICITIATMGIGAGGVASGFLYLLIRAFDISQADSVQKFLLIGMFLLVGALAASSTYAHYRARFDLNIFKGKPKKTPNVQKTKINKDMEKAAEAINNTKVPTPTPVEEKTESFSIFELDEIDDGQTKKPYTNENETGEVEFSEEAQNQKMFLINFLGVSLGSLKGPDASAETLNRFGLNMFMCGAVMRMAQDHGLKEEESREILLRIIEMLGAKTEQAERFADEYERHLSHPRHLALFEQSGDIAARYADGDQSAPLYIRSTLEEWANWAPDFAEDINPNLLTIMFTDMVGSTDLTTKHGDYAAQEVLKSHDMIVRTALTNFEGREIKHLGDGIMASFKNFDLALQAGIEIHKRVEGNNNADPEFPLHIRMGMHAGEPIQKNNDLFGTAVQLAARLCDFTDGDQISVSQDLVDLCGDRPVYTFIDLGPQTLKGFEQPQHVYRLDWKAPPRTYEGSENEVIDTQEDQEKLPESICAPLSIDGVAPDMSVRIMKAPIKRDEGFNEGLPSNPKKETSPPEKAAEPPKTS